MAFGMSATEVPGKEKVGPSPASMKLAYKPKGKKPLPESKETPKSEAQSHPPAFLRKAAAMAGKKC